MASVGFKTASTSNYFGNASSNKYTSIRKTVIDGSKKQTVNALDITDFRATKDPVYEAFRHIEDRPVSTLAVEFLQETFIQPIMKMIAA